MPSTAAARPHSLNALHMAYEFPIISTVIALPATTASIRSPFLDLYLFVDAFKVITSQDSKNAKMRTGLLNLQLVTKSTVH